MKKKKRNSAAGAAASVGGTPVTAMDPDGDIKTLIHEHALFFDKLIELIPARFYLPTDNQDKVWFQGLSKKEKAEAKQKSIENTKKSRRDRLDPEKPSKSTLDLLKETLESGKLEDPSKEENVGSLIDDDDDDDVDGTVKVGNRDSGDQSVTYEELRERLHKKIEELRAGRGGGENKEKREEKKRKRNEEWTKKHEGGKREAEERESERAMEEEVDEAAKGIRFGKVKLGEEERETRMKKKKKMTKEEELEKALKLEEAKRDPNKGEIVAKKQSWKAAKERAMGKKVHDNPKLIKESIQKAKRRQNKSAEKWRERVQTTEKMKQERQDKRKENIKNKIEKKRMKKIERREKKLMRPGFEGRKEGFINGD